MFSPSLVINLVGKSPAQIWRLRSLHKSAMRLSSHFSPRVTWMGLTRTKSLGIFAEIPELCTTSRQTAPASFRGTSRSFCTTRRREKLFTSTQELKSRRSAQSFSSSWTTELRIMWIEQLTEASDAVTMDNMMHSSETAFTCSRWSADFQSIHEWLITCS